MQNIQPHIEEAMRTTAFQQCHMSANGLRLHFAPDAATHFEQRLEQQGLRCYEDVCKRYPQAEEYALCANGHCRALCIVLEEARHADPHRFAPRSLARAIKDLADELAELKDRRKAKRIATKIMESAGGKKALFHGLGVPYTPRQGRNRRRSGKPKCAPSA